MVLMSVIALAETDVNFTNRCSAASSSELTWYNYVISALAAAIYIHWWNDVMTHDVISFHTGEMRACG